MSDESLRAFINPDRFIAGTVGEPGSRSFYLQVREAGELMSIALEKEQLIALAERLSIMLRELRIPQVQGNLLEFNSDNSPLESPVSDDFRAQAIAIAYDENLEKIDVELESEETELVAIFLTLPQTRSFIRRSQLVINSGRAVCPFCSAPISPQGHLCPRANGYRR